MKRHWLALALTVVGCFGPDANVLFERDTDGASTPVAGSGSPPSGGAQSGTDSGQYVSGAPTGGTGAVGAAGSGASAASGGTLGGTGGGGGNGGGEPQVPVIESCDMVEGSVVWPSNGHCYRVNEEQLTFAEASRACQLAAGHLVTIANAEENDFARSLRQGEHWLGATDQLADDVPGVGTYIWVTGEPWEFSDWENGQPNAYETPCPDDDDADCYEHCGFQTDEGDWKDRSCWHTIASICEWDVMAPSGEGGAGGAPDSEPNRPNGPG